MIGAGVSSYFKFGLFLDQLAGVLYGDNRDLGCYAKERSWAIGVLSTLWCAAQQTIPNVTNPGARLEMSFNGRVMLVGPKLVF